MSVVDSGDGEGIRGLEKAVSEAQRSSGITLSQEVVKISLDMEEEEAQQQCQWHTLLSFRGVCCHLANRRATDSNKQ